MQIDGIKKILNQQGHKQLRLFLIILFFFHLYSSGGRFLPLKCSFFISGNPLRLRSRSYSRSFSRSRSLSLSLPRSRSRDPRLLERGDLLLVLDRRLRPPRSRDRVRLRRLLL